MKISKLGDISKNFEKKKCLPCRKNVVNLRHQTTTKYNQLKSTTMEKAKTFEQMLKAYKAIRKQIMDAKLDDITAVEITEYNDPSRYHSWININIHFGKGGDFVENQCTLVCIHNDRFKQGMEAYKVAIAERINQPNN